MGVGARCWGEPVLSRCGRREPGPLAKGAGSECTPVEEVKPERVLSEDRCITRFPMNPENPPP